MAEPSAQRPSARSARGLDGCVFFVADVQTGFGAFVSVFLTEQKWTQADIGLLLTISGLVSLFGQAPCGALVDAVRSERALAAASLAFIAASAFAFAGFPVFGVALVSRLVLAIASTTLGLAINAISLGLAGERGLAQRLGRNAAFASAGTGIAAALMGGVGYWVSDRSVFYIAGLLAAPAALSLFRIDPTEIGPASDAARGDRTTPRSLIANLGALLRQRRLVLFAICVMMFHLANAAMLPLAAGLVTERSAKLATLLVAVAIVGPQFTVTLLSPFVARFADSWGRRPLLLFGFAALALRGAMFAFTRDPRALAAIQLLDGVSGATLGVLVPLVIADVTRECGHFNLAQGAVGCAMGLGASLSTTLSGSVSDRFGGAVAFDMLAILAALGLALLAATMPETKPAAVQVETAESRARPR